MSFQTSAEGAVVVANENNNLSNCQEHFYKNRQCKSENIEFKEIEKVNSNSQELWDQHKIFSTGIKRRLFQANSDFMIRKSQKFSNQGRKTDQCMDILPVLQENYEIQNVEGDNYNFFAGNSGVENVSQNSADNYFDYSQSDNKDIQQSFCVSQNSDIQTQDNLENFESNLFRDYCRFQTPVQTPKRLFFETPQSTSKIQQHFKQQTSQLQVFSEEDFLGNQNALNQQNKQLQQQSFNSYGDSRRTSRGSCEEVSSDFSNNIDCIMYALDKIGSEEILNEQKQDQSAFSDDNCMSQNENNNINNNNNKNIQNIQEQFIAVGFTEQIWKRKYTSEFFSGIKY